MCTARKERPSSGKLLARNQMEQKQKVCSKELITWRVLDGWMDGGSGDENRAHQTKEQEEQYEWSW